MKYPGPLRPDAMARMIRMLPLWERQLVALAVNGKTAAEIATLLDSTEEAMAKSMRAALITLNVDTWEAPVFESRPLRRVLGEVYRSHALQTILEKHDHQLHE